jgi:hypothetical protein
MNVKFYIYGQEKKKGGKNALSFSEHWILVLGLVFTREKRRKGGFAIREEDTLCKPFRFEHDTVRPLKQWDLYNLHYFNDFCLPCKWWVRILERSQFKF